MRLAVFGQTHAGRYIVAIVEKKGGGVYRPITARIMDSQERRHFRARRGRG